MCLYCKPYVCVFTNLTVYVTLLRINCWITFQSPSQQLLFFTQFSSIVSQKYKKFRLFIISSNAHAENQTLKLFAQILTKICNYIICAVVNFRIPNNVVNHTSSMIEALIQFDLCKINVMEERIKKIDWRKKNPNNFGAILVDGQNPNWIWSDCVCMTHCQCNKGLENDIANWPTNRTVRQCDEWIAQKAKEKQKKASKLKIKEELQRDSSVRKWFKNT